jgi:hypothetical protein
VNHSEGDNLTTQIEQTYETATTHHPAPTHTLATHHRRALPYGEHRRTRRVTKERAPTMADQPPTQPTPNHGDHQPGLPRRRFLGLTAAATGAGLTAAACSTNSTNTPTATNTPNNNRATLGHHPPTTEWDKPGSPDWRITNQGPDDAIVGYTNKVSVTPGEHTTLHVSTTGRQFRVSAYRVGWYGGAQARLVWRSPNIHGAQQAAPTFNETTRTISTNWDANLTLDTADWPPGAYLLRLDADTGQRYVPLIVRSTNGQHRSILMHAPATWQAYNLWGGYSLYQGENGAYTTRSYVVSFDRPYDDCGAIKFMVYERAAVVLAERLRIPLAYTTGLDVHRDPSILTGAHALYTLGHDEYWTTQQRAHITAARDTGTNLAFLGANTCFRRIRFDNTDAGPYRTVTCYKTAYDRDPLYGHDDTNVTTDYREPPAADPESSLTGVLYEGYPVDAPYTVQTPDHWLYHNTGATQGTTFDHLVGVEYDRVTPNAPTPRPIQVLAHSPLVCNGTHSHSDTAYYTTNSGAGVFASGTMRWVESMMAGGTDDGDDHGISTAAAHFTTQVNTNLMRAFAEGPAAHTKPAPHDNLNQIYDT